LAATTALILGGLWLVDRVRGDDPSPVNLDQAGAAPRVGEPAPSFSGVDIAGHPVAVPAGVPTWVVFGATWCADCRIEAPDVQRAFEDQGDQALIVSLYVGQTADTVADYAQRLGLTYPQVADPDSAVARAWQIDAIPTHYFIDADGVIAEIVYGGISAEAAARRLAQLS
jgi:peroxiredoxin